MSTVVMLRFAAIIWHWQSPTFHVAQRAFDATLFSAGLNTLQLALNLNEADGAHEAYGTATMNSKAASPHE